MSAVAEQSIVQIKLSQVISALSYALDITEGQPQGHAARTCMLGMRIAQEIHLGPDESSALFYALLLKDLGCSNNSAKMCYLFGSDDRITKREAKTINWVSTFKSLGYVIRNISRGKSTIDKIQHFARIVRGGQREAKSLVELRCERGAAIARELEFPDLTAAAIRNLDEHWDGHGHPDGLSGAQIPLLARVLSIAQTAEVFVSGFGLEVACEMARGRSGTWFDPELVRVFLNIKNDREFWKRFHSEKPAGATATFEPGDRVLIADESQLDRIAQGFSKVIDAKSPWTFRHSEGVAKIAAGIAELMGYSAQEVRYIRRAALLHDIGKLGISNLILDKPGKLTPDELTVMRRHALYTQQILSHVDGFKDLADLAASHHERLDGKGYHRGLTVNQLSAPARILCVADIYEALTAKRPYRQDLTDEQVTTILARNLTGGICPAVYEVLQSYLARGGYSPEQIAA
ncbi:MAG TPA: HD domain-containing phosphohydrolase [Tepidisphaeraceae bacterium]|jgi:putative nucleotidyltransferase with HDIG domain|nr:HD domain-containing phosphohydrolase [Tepidisphaeraceae bacterium]